MSNSDSSVLAGFAAETLLGSDAHVIKAILALRDDLRYSSKGNEISLDDAFIQLQSSVDSLPCIVLDTDVPPGTENEYLIRLSTAQEKVLDDCDRVLRAILSYQSQLKNAERAIKKYKADFMSWYVLAAAYVIAQHEVKFPPSQIKQLAEAEFSRLLDNVDVQIDNLINSVEHLIAEARQHKKIQSEKHGLGKDQANASWTSKMANFPGIPPNRADDMAQEFAEEDDEEDEVPAFVSRQPQVGSAPAQPTQVVALPSGISQDQSAILEDAIQRNAHPEKAVTSNQDLLDEAKPGDTVMLRFQDNVAPMLEGIKDTMRITGPVAAPEEVAEFLNACEPVQVDELPTEPAVMAGGPIHPRKRLILTEDEDLM